MLKGMLGYKEKLLFQEKKAFCLKFVNNLFIFFLQEKPRVSVKKFVKIGRPGYKGIRICLC